ncbi:MAG: hypothetical protein R3F17_08090 [Planctomycetota bacterium]
MRFLLFLAVFLVLWASDAHAQDPLVAKAVARIVTVEGQEATLAPGDAKEAARLLDSLAWAEKRIAGVVQKNTEEWKAADVRAKALRKKIEDKAKAPAPQPTPAPAPAPAPQPTPAPAPAPQPAPAPTPAPTPAPAPAPQPAPAPAPAPQPAPQVDMRALEALNHDVGNSYNNLKDLPLSFLTDASRVGMYKNDIAKFRRRLSVFPDSDSNVQLVKANIDDLEKLLDAGIAAINKDKEAGAGADDRIEGLFKKYGNDKLPTRIEDPFTEAQVRAWCSEMRRFREKELPEDRKWLESLASNTSINRQRYSSATHHLNRTVPLQLDETEFYVRERLASDANEGLRAAEWILETDPKKPDHVSNRILGKGRLDENMTWLQKGAHSVEMARVYDEAMGAPCVMGVVQNDPEAPAPEKPDRKAQAEKIQKAIQHLKDISVVALESVRMPKVMSEDPELLRIAAETLALEKYGIAGWKKLVINMNVRDQIRREAWLRPGTVSATIEYYEYKWKEYQVTTAEQVGEELWLFANTLKFYESGDPTTPVGHWILSKRFELTRILPENLEKPPLEKKKD